MREQQQKWNILFLCSTYNIPTDIAVVYVYDVFASAAVDCKWYTQKYAKYWYAKRVVILVFGCCGGEGEKRHRTTRER